jgi:hypothetical protein
MAITVTTHTDPPSADLYITDLPATTAYAWLWRSWASKQARVRGDAHVAIIDDEATMVDYDVPVGRPFSYRVQCFAADGSDLGFVGPTSEYEIAFTDRRMMWLSDPLVPALARLVMLEDSTDRSRTYEAPTTYAQVIGRRRPVAIGGARSTASDWTFRIWSFSFDESTAIEDLAGGGGVLLCRPHPEAIRHRDGLIYMSTPGVVEEPRRELVTRRPQGADWVLAGREVEPPSISVVAPVRTWQDVIDENPTWQDVINTHATWLDVIRG